MKYVTVKEMQAIERQADANGLSYAQMMENAGKGLGETVDTACRHIEEKTVLGLVGSGNNGGDTLVALAYLAQRGWKATAYIVKPRSPDDELVERLKNQKGDIIQCETDLNFDLLRQVVNSHAVLLDGILGTGFHLPLKGAISEVLSEIKRAIRNDEAAPIVIAVDCPSGVDCDTGEVAADVLAADLTVTMAAVKAGFLKLPAFQYMGDIEVVSIGKLDNLSAWNEIKRHVPDAQYVKSVLPERHIDSHKGTFGTALICAGSQNYTGASLLAGKAAYYSGAGLVTLAIPGCIHTAVAGQFPEATWIILPDEAGAIAESAIESLVEEKGRATALLVGPGFGLHKSTELFVGNLLRETSRKTIEIPMVFDADGLKLLAKSKNWQDVLPRQTVLTPHPGEMSVLTGLSVHEIQSDRINIAEKYAIEWGHVVVLKGAFTVVASPDGISGVLPVASPALARAGSGDVLAGVITGLRAQGLNAFDASVAGAWIHGQAGLKAADTLGCTASVLAGDILAGCVHVMADLESLE